jgi:hypothetical protein
VECGLPEVQAACPARVDVGVVANARRLRESSCAPRPPPPPHPTPRRQITFSERLKLY